MEEFLKTIILGTLQGLTEFLPISSTGHLVIGRKLFGLSEAGLFLDTMLHFGTFISVIIVFWDKIIQIIKKPNSKLLKLLVIGTIPTALIGLIFQDLFEEISKTGVTIGWEFLITGLILWFADNRKNLGSKGIEQIKYKDALIIGALQGAAIMPAISRSGLTIAGALFMGVKREDAATFSFLISLPAILGAVILQSFKMYTNEIAVNNVELIPILAGTIVAAISGYIAIKWMLKILINGSLKIFSIYVWILGITILIFQFLGKW
ncbi:MAG: undecaprenyl-diphosphate phosphatase [Vulcanibacillus sp.]